MDKVAMLSEILAQNPADTFARYGLAMEHASQGSLDSSIAEFDRLLEDNPEYVPPDISCRRKHSSRPAAPRKQRSAWSRASALQNRQAISTH